MALNDDPLWDPDNPVLKDLLRKHPEWLTDPKMRDALKGLSDQGENDTGMTQVRLTPQMKRLYLFFFAGLVLALWAALQFGSFDANAPLFCQPHWWLLIPMYLASPRLFAFYYLLCGKPTLGHPLEILLLGVILAPRAWGMFALPGLSVSLPLRLTLAIAAHVAFQIVIPVAVARKNFSTNVENMTKSLQKLYEQMNCYVDESIPRRIAATILVMWMIIPGIVGVAWLYVRDYSYNKGIVVGGEKALDELAKEAGFANAKEMQQALCTPDLQFAVGTKATPSSEGYLTSDNYVPLRAIARRPNIDLFEKHENISRRCGSAIGTMKTWYPYFVFERKECGLAIGESLNTKPEARYWVRISHCFCWTTRECLSLEKERPTYKTLKEAKEDESGAKGMPYAYRFSEHFERVPTKRGVEHRIAALPVLDRQESVFWCVAKADEVGAGGYQVCWIRWDGKDDAVTLRFRVTRNEFERYLNGLYKLLREARDMIALLGIGVDFATTADLSERSDAGTIKKRLDGVRMLTGYLVRKPESEMERVALKEKVLRNLEINNSPDIWDCNDVAYLTPDMVY